MCRYETLWLPLAVKYPGKNLLPPLDIHWIWHCHLLAPYYYEKDCQRLVGQVLDHRLYDAAGYQHALLTAVRLWQEAYPSEPFQIELTHDSSRKYADYTSQCKYDIESAVGRQRMFYYQVSLPHFCDGDFLKAALKRYKMYLTLKRMNMDLFLVPCYDFDLIWHSHQLHPLLYKRDTTAVLGMMFNHDDSVNDRAPDSKLNRSDDQTRQLWKDTFGEEFFKPGAMFRGEPPFGQLHLVTTDQVMAVSSKMADVTINSVKVENAGDSMDPHFQLKLNLSNPSQQNAKADSTILKLKGPQTEWANSGKGITKFKFDTKKYMGLQFELIDKKGFLCFSANESHGRLTYPMGSVVDSTPPCGKVVEQTVELKNGVTSRENGLKDTRVDDNGLTVSFSASVDAPDKGPCILSLVPGEFGSFTMPENIKQMWGPIPLPRLPDDVSNICIVASHK